MEGAADNLFQNVRPRVEIGDSIWICGGSIILPGVTIGENSVIGAGSVVNRPIPANCIAVGSPCRVLRRFDAGDSA